MLKRAVLCGVGGQGTILAAHVLAKVAMDSGYDVKVSEIHGMSQRGGSVSTVVTFGDEVTSMVAGEHSADMIVSFELLEAARNLSYLKSDGVVITGDEIIKPASVLTGNFKLPKDVRGSLEEMGAMIVPAASTAHEAGNPKTSNIVMLGALSVVLPFESDIWERTISEHVPQKTIDVNLTAFRLGRAFAEEHTSA